MRELLDNRLLVLSVRLVVGAIFLFSSIEKAADPRTFAVLVDNYRLLPYSFSLGLASFLPWLELVCGLCLILGISFRGASLLVGSLTCVFTVAVISGILRGLDISCGCFTLDPEASKIGWQKVIENAGLIFLSAYLVLSRTDGFTFFHRGDAAS